MSIEGQGRRPDKGRESYLGEVLEFSARAAFGKALERYNNGQWYRSQVEQTLRPLFHDTGGQKYVLDQYMVFDGWIRFGDNSPTVQKYLSALTRFVVDRLRCTQEGEVPYWLLHTIHSDVAQSQQWYGSMLAEFPTLDDSSKTNLEIEVRADGSVRVALFNGVTGEHLPVLGGDETVHSDFGRRFDYWDDLRRRAAAALDVAIDHLKTEHLQHTADFETKNVVNLERMQSAADDLVAWHWGRKTPPSSARRSKSTELRRILDLDPVR